MINLPQNLKNIETLDNQIATHTQSYTRAILNSVIEYLDNYSQQEAEECINYLQTMESMFGTNKELFNRTMEKLYNIIGRERARLAAELCSKRNAMRTPRPPTRDQAPNTPSTPAGSTTPQGGTRRPRGPKRNRSRSMSRPRQPNGGQGQPGQQGQRTNQFQGQGQQQQGFRGRRPQPRGNARGGARRPGQYRVTPQNPAPTNLQQQQGFQPNLGIAVMQGLQAMMNSLNMPQ